MSGSSYACQRSSEKMNCEKKTTSKEETSDSCQKECCSKEHSSKKDQHGCSGKCDHSSCTTSGLQYSLMAINEFEFSNNLFNFSLEKVTPYYKDINISDGFTSIWLPPKI